MANATQCDSQEQVRAEIDRVDRQRLALRARSELAEHAALHPPST